MAVGLVGVEEHGAALGVLRVEGLENHFAQPGQAGDLVELVDVELDPGLVFAQLVLDGPQVGDLDGLLHQSSW